MKLTKPRIRQLRRIYENIVTHYGESKFQDDTPELEFFYDHSYDVAGEWDSFSWGSEISVNFAMVSTMRDAVKTIIHEYQHHLQSPSWYTRYMKTHGYDDHPYEIEAWAVADRDIGLFWPQKPGSRAE